MTCMVNQEIKILVSESSINRLKAKLIKVYVRDFVLTQF